MVLLVGFFLRSVDWRATGAVLAQAPLWPAQAVALLLYAAGQVANGLGWRHLVRRAGIELSVGRMIRHDLGSVFWSVVLPGSLAGELIKGARVAGGMQRAESTAMAILSARLVGGGVAAGLALALLPLAMLEGPARMLGRLALWGVVGVAIVGLLVVKAGPPAVRRILPAIAARIPPGRPPALSELAFCATSSLVAHLCFSGVYLCYFRAVGAAPGFPDASVNYALTTVAQALPITFGGLGVRELTMAGLGAGVVGAPQAAAASVLGTATFALPVALGGVLELARILRGRALTSERG